MNAPIFVHVDLAGNAYPLGRLWTHTANGRESASFEHLRSWLDNPLSKRFQMDPAVPCLSGIFHTAEDHKVFHVMSDCLPDRWGRALFRLQARKIAESENRSPRTLLERDYLLGVADDTRQGALRFSLKENGPFLSAMSSPLFMNAIWAAAQSAWNITKGEFLPEDLAMLFAPGSSMGGARPKAVVRNVDGGLFLAKFAGATDTRNVTRWEALTLTLAQKAGLDVPEFFVKNRGEKSILFLRRFDRDGTARIPFQSAMTLLQARDMENRSYVEIVDAMTPQAANLTKDKEELWSRMVFNILVSNFDDHLRNHGFLFGERGWRLSPCYDLEISPIQEKPRYLHTHVFPDVSEARIGNALEYADEFGLSLPDAKRRAYKIAETVKTWRGEAKLLGLKASEIEEMSSCFEHEELRAALALG